MRAGSRTGRKVRRSLRRRRVATRAWWMPSSPASRRTTGSWRSSRCTERGHCVLEALGAAGAPLRRGDRRIGRGERPRAKGAGQLGHGVRLAGARGPQRADHGVDDRVRRARRHLDLDLAEAQADVASPSSTDTSSSATLPSGRSAGSQIGPGARRSRRWATGSSGGPAEHARQQPGQWSGGGSGSPSSSSSSRSRARPSLGAGSLSGPAARRPVLPGAVAEGDAEADQAQVGGVEVAGVEDLLVGASR